MPEASRNDDGMPSFSKVDESIVHGTPSSDEDVSYFHVMDGHGDHECFMVAKSDPSASSGPKVTGVVVQAGSSVRGNEVMWFTRRAYAHLLFLEGNICALPLVIVSMTRLGRINCTGAA
jgi:hypothetical protein